MKVMHKDKRQETGIMVIDKNIKSELQERRVNVHGMVLDKFNAGSHSLIDIGEAKIERDFKLNRRTK